MKTLQEAMSKISSTVFTEPRELASVEELSRELEGSPSPVANMKALAILTLLSLMEGDDPEKSLETSLKAAFIAGIRIGQEMEKMDENLR